jgi:hypothetical protein
MTLHCTPRVFRLVAAWVFFLAGGGAALAQNALGDGHALDRNLQKGSGGRNTVTRDIQEQIRFNNAVITGNAPGGRSFRGYVGYLAPDDFRAALGSNELFSFRRDSTGADLVGQGIRGTDALRYQFELSTGQAPPSMMGTSFGYASRSGAAGGTLASALRSTSDFLTQQATRPSIVGYRATSDGTQFAMTASPLLGVSAVQVTGQTSAVPGTTTTLPAGGTPGATGIPGATIPGAPASGKLGGELSGLEAGGRGVVNPLTLSRVIDRSAASSQVDTRVDVPSVVAESLRAQYGPGEKAPSAAKPEKPGQPGQAPPPPLPGESTEGTLRVGWEAQLDRLRQQLSGQPGTLPSKDSAKDQAPSSPAPGTPPVPGLPPSSRTPAPGDERGGASGQSRSIIDSELAKVDPRLLRALQRARPTMTRLGTGDLDKPLVTVTYKSHMDAAQTLLAQGRYFDAEDRFLRALAVVPRDPMAGIGRVHAQLGAGLYLSAASNLRAVFIDHPEMVGVRYDASLLPSADRIDAIAGQLRESIKVKGSALGRDAALLLAYLGYQRHDAAMTSEGLDALAEWIQVGDTGAATLTGLLQKVWIEGEKAPEAPPAIPPPAPAPGAKPADKKDGDTNK